jgi:hypothetical protein
MYLYGNLNCQYSESEFRFHKSILPKDEKGCGGWKEWKLMPLQMIRRQKEEDALGTLITSNLGTISLKQYTDFNVQSLSEKANISTINACPRSLPKMRKHSYSVIARIRIAILLKEQKA